MTWVLTWCPSCSLLFRNRGEKRMSAFECVRKVYRSDGIKGFYRGMSASYAGISETVIHFVIYESIKRKLLEYKTASAMDNEDESAKEASDFVGMMMAAATSKTCATSIAYPHGKLRAWTSVIRGSLVTGICSRLWLSWPRTITLTKAFRVRLSESTRVKCLEMGVFLSAFLAWLFHRQCLFIPKDLPERVCFHLDSPYILTNFTEFASKFFSPF